MQGKIENFRLAIIATQSLKMFMLEIVLASYICSYALQLVITLHELHLDTLGYTGFHVGSAGLAIHTYIHVASYACCYTW